MQDVLKAVLGIENLCYGILRISTPTLGIQGRIAIADARYVVDASIVGSQESDSSYHCLCKLLSLYEGNFAFLDAGAERPADFTELLYIPIDRLAEALQKLPDNPHELFDEKALLDKVFSANEVSMAVKPTKLPTSGAIQTFKPLRVANLKNHAQEEARVAAADKRASKSSPLAANWNLVELLFDNPESAPKPTPNTAIAEVPGQQNQNAEQQRESMTRLRALPISDQPLSVGGFLRKNTNIILFAAMMLAILIFALLMLYFTVINPSRPAGGSIHANKQDG